MAETGTPPIRGAAAARLKAGLDPGATIYTGHHADDPVHVTILRYGDEPMPEATVSSLEACKSGPGVTWVNVDGVHDIDVVKRIGDAFGIHALAQEDALNPSSRPKVEDHGDHLFVVAKQARMMPDGTLDIEHFGIGVGASWLVSFQEREGGDVLEPVRARVKAGRMRMMATDFLLHAILDGIVDGYFVVLARFEEEVDALEASVLDVTGAEFPSDVHQLRVRLGVLRRTIWPLREAVGTLVAGMHPLLDKKTRPYWRDLQDHVLHALELCDSLRDRLGSTLDLHLAVVSNRTNQVMRVLTVMATLFIPMTFVVGVYGMNFDYMPELRWRYGYPAVMGAMLVTVIGMLAWFRRRNWM